MLLNKIWRTILQYRAQFLAMVIMITFGVGIFNGFNMEWTSLEKVLNRFFTETNQADYYIYTDDLFLREDQNKLLGSDFINEATRSLTFEARVNEREGDNLAVVAPEDLNVSGAVLIDDSEPFDCMSKDGVWISEKYAKANNFKKGDEITLSYGSYVLHGKIAGTIHSAEYLICLRDDNQAMPDYDTFGYAYVSPSLVAEALGQSLHVFKQMNVTSDLSKEEFRRELKNLTGKDYLVVAKEDSWYYQGAQQQINEGKVISQFLPILFFVIAVLTMISTMNRITAKEKTQIGTLKALGFKNRKIIAHYASYSIFIGLIGVVLGTGLGYLIAFIVMNPKGTLGTYIDMPYWTITLPWFCYVIMAALLVLFAIVGAVSTKKMLKGNAAQVLRPYSPKVVKKTIVDKLPIFDSAGFATKWNLRDISRNKIRTFMSFIGVAGCMMMLVSAVGLRDTMDSYVDIFFGDAMKYSTQIELDEKADNNQALAIANKYDGDYSGSVSIELNNESASLDVYNIKNRENNGNLICFVDNEGEYRDISESGALICRRLADSNNIEVGDTIKVNLYGKTDSYELKVNGIIQSMSKNIVITPTYAQKINLQYSIDSIYTVTDQKEIATDTYIKTTQCKQDMVDSYNSYMELINLLIVVLLITSVILGITVLYNLGMMGYTERYKDMATLKVIGFKNRVIAKVLISQNLWITVVGIIAGLPCGYLLIDQLIKKLGDEFEMDTVLGWQSYVISIGVTFGVSLLVAMFIARKNKDIDMVESMKGNE